MADIKQQIFHELATLEEMAARCKATAVNAGRQTDLEVAILTEQIKNMRERNTRVVQMIDQSVSVLKKLKQ